MIRHTTAFSPPLRPSQARRSPRAATRGFGLILLLLVIPLSAAPAQEAVKPAGPDPVRAAQEVFEDSEFWWKRTEEVNYALPWYQSLWNAIVNFLWRIAKDLLSWLWTRLLKPLLEWLWGLSGLEPGDWSSGTQLVWLAAALLLIWAAWKAYPLLARWLRGAAPGPVRKEAGALQELPEAGLLFEQASQACHERCYAECIRLALLALIARLQQEQLLRYDASRTNREYQADLRPRPELASLFGEVARPFERVWYGGMPAVPGEAERVLEACRPIVTGEVVPA